MAVPNERQKIEGHAWWALSPFRTESPESASRMEGFGYVYISK